MAASLGSVLSIMTAGEGQCTAGASCEPDWQGRGEGDFIEELNRARQQLFTGRLDYTKPATLHLAVEKPVYFHAQISGRWNAVQKGRASAKVAVGGQVKVALHCSGAATCTPISSKRQLVTGDRRFKEATAWVWEVTPKKAGTARFALTVTSYYEDTETVLYEKPPIIVQAKVKAAPKDEGPFAWFADLYGWVKKMLEELALLAGALAVILGLWAAWKTRNSASAANLPSSTGTSPPASGGSAGQQAQGVQQQQSATATTTTSSATSGNSPSGTA
ncbi:hypothetical protein OG241_45815 [Streptomyces sp. NBC_01390]|uniref:hypothetical protein n=1 Tax=Streptomyces sp. NBC_01390 TaxID=2903850 RepID=UPI00324904A3